MKPMFTQTRWFIHVLIGALLALVIAIPAQADWDWGIVLPLLYKDFTASPMSPTPTATRADVATSTVTPTVTHTMTAEPAASETATFSPTSTLTPSPSLTITMSATPSPTRTATATASATMTPTPIPTHTATLTPTLEIRGLVTQRGEPVEGVPLQLGICGISLQPEIVQNKESLEDGSYYFHVAAGALPAGASYGVIYENDVESPVEGRLALWRAEPFMPDMPSGSIPGGDFDVADIELVGPDSTEPRPLPVTFEWLARDPQWVEQETYRVKIWDQRGNVFLSDDDLALVDAFRLEGLPAGFSFDKVYQWQVLIWSEDGYGESLEAGTVVFAAS